MANAVLCLNNVREKILQKANEVQFVDFWRKLIQKLQARSRCTETHLYAHVYFGLFVTVKAD